MSGKHALAIAVAFGLICAWSAQAAPRKHAGVDGTRSPAVHHIPLFDEEYNAILPSDRAPHPFSTKNTCGDCHDYDVISKGLHFNPEIADAARAYDAYRGEPWVLVDEPTGTAIPFTNGPAKSGWVAQDLGLTAWEFTKRFSRHMPGGEPYEAPNAPIDPKARWDVSGKPDVNCLACHNMSREQNQSEYAIQCARENFRWAPTAASWLGVVDNMASRLPDTYDPYVAPNLDNAWAAPPKVTYRQGIFDAKDRVFFDVKRQSSAERCDFCHSVSTADDPAGNRWHAQKDVHMAAGMTCTDCHRNGLDHQIVTGREHAPGGETFSCRGCHYGTGDGDANGIQPRAPRPKHVGLPPLHLDKLSCTTCHSGPYPGKETETVRTARANRLGIHGKALWDTDLPYIQAPVFERQSDGRIMPMYAMWPAFWGVKKSDTTKPLPLDLVSPIVAQAKATPTPQDAPAKEQEPAPAEASAALASSEGTATQPDATKPTHSSYTPLTEQQIVAALTALAASGKVDGTPVYVCSGDEYALDAKGALVTNPDATAAAPQRWQLGHDVRPASQSLGAKGCTECHSTTSPFFFANVAMKGPAATAAATQSRPMYAFLKESPSFQRLWGVEFQLRPLFKVVIFAACALIAAVLALYAFRGLTYLMKRV